MRVNVYAEEITSDVEVVEKNGFRGLRFILHSARALHDRPGDDDRSAVTFWGLKKMKPLLERALTLLKE